MQVINGPIVVAREQGVKDLGSVPEADRFITILDKVHFTDALVLDLRGCYVDYPATPKVIDSIFRRFQSYEGPKKMTLVLRPTIWQLDSLAGIFAKESEILREFEKPTAVANPQKRSTRQLLADYCKSQNITFQIYVIESIDSNRELSFQRLLRCQLGPVHSRRLIQSPTIRRTRPRFLAVPT